MVWNPDAARGTATRILLSRYQIRVSGARGVIPRHRNLFAFYFSSTFFVLRTHCGGGNKPDETHILKYLWAFLLLAYDVDNIAWEQNMCALWDQHNRHKGKNWNSAARKNYIRPEDLPTFSRNITPSKSILFNQCTMPPRSILSYAILFFRDNKFGIKTFPSIRCMRKKQEKLIRFFMDSSFARFLSHRYYLNQKPARERKLFPRSYHRGLNECKESWVVKFERIQWMQLRWGKIVS